ncbi:DUF5709 domain-containing protein [Kitasatospora sp. NPDC058190]|uniref:DUF5709 domain-containing protein n=1 Tax=Kitasatospora sp. NPDC058190 TaxID=3346371 RepID=UPI0036D9CD59
MNAEPHDPGVPPDDEGIPDLHGEAPTAERAEDPQRPAVPVDRPVAAESYGTTPAEQQHGEPLADRLAQEEAEIPSQAADDTTEPTAGRLVSEDEGLRERTTQQEVAEETDDHAGLSAEEAAVHVRRVNVEDLDLPAEE